MKQEREYFALIVASVIMIMALKILGVLDFELPVVVKEIPKNKANNEFLYPIILGAVFALIGTPCSTPILASIMAFASISAKVSQAIIMLFLFSSYKLLHQMQLLLVSRQQTVAPLDHVVHALTADPQILRHLAERTVIQNHIFIDSFLMSGQQLAVKIIQKRLSENLFHFDHPGYLT